MIDTKAIAKRIRDGRKHRLRLTQEDLGIELGIKQSAVSDLENAKKGSGINDLHRLMLLARTLEMDLPYLVFGIGDDGLPHFGEEATLAPVHFRRLTKAHRKLLLAVSQSDNLKATLMGAYEYATYRAYVLVGNEEPTNRLAVLIHDNAIVATARGKTIPLNQALASDPTENQPYARILNPYAVMAESDSKETAARFDLEAIERMEELRSMTNEKLLIIDYLYVEESLREHGLARFLIEALRNPAETTSVWLSLKPIERLDPNETAHESVIEPGQIMLNASIAERLGFTVDEMREAVTVKSREECGRLYYPLWAYRLSKTLSELVRDDEFVQEMALAQTRLRICEAKLKEQKEDK